MPDRIVVLHGHIFKNAGTTMEKDPIDVFDHDFRTDAEALAVPYGIYD